jgi:hypothetical protein
MSENIELNHNLGDGDIDDYTILQWILEINIFQTHELHWSGQNRIEWQVLVLTFDQVKIICIINLRASYP